MLNLSIRVVGVMLWYISRKKKVIISRDSIRFLSYFFLRIHICCKYSRILLLLIIEREFEFGLFFVLFQIEMDRSIFFCCVATKTKIIWFCLAKKDDNEREFVQIQNIITTKNFHIFCHSYIYIVFVDSILQLQFNKKRIFFFFYS